MKRIILFFVMIYLIVPSGRLYAKALVKGERGSVFLSEWFSSADAWWEISGEGFDVDLGKDVSIRSRLEYKNTDSNITMIGGQLNLDKLMMLRIAYGAGDIDNGTVIDHDWISVPVDSAYNLKISESREMGRGDTSVFDIGGGFLVSKPDASYKLNLYAGYFYYEDNIRMTNGVQTYADDTYCLGPPSFDGYCFYPAGTPITGLNSTFDFQWEYLKLGVDGEARKNKFGLEGGIYFLHLLDYTGRGFWNLRPFRFIHKADKGYGVEANVSGSYAITKFATVRAGYRYFMLKAKDGTDTTYVTGYTPSVQPLDDVEAKRYGPYFSLEVKF